MITLEANPLGYILESDLEPDTILIQTDYDYPGLACTFGWCPCDCGFTDGTVDCEHRTATEMITEAAEYLDDHIGDSVDDPGYF